jgi:hypothetical protein
MLCLTFVCLVVGYGFYWGLGGNRYGPRFYFEAYPLIALGVTAVVFGSGIPIRVQKCLQVIFLLGCAFTLFAFKAHTALEHQVVENRMSLYRLVESEEIKNAVIFVASRAPGPRLMDIGDLLRNSIDWAGSVLYVRDLGPKRKRRLMAFYSDREFYRYSREKGDVTGSLEYIENPNNKERETNSRKKPNRATAE